MFDHPFFTEQISRFDEEQMERAAARRRMLVEHADQIVPRPAGAVRRLLRRIVRGSTVHPAPTSAASGARSAHTAVVCDRTAAPAR